MLFNSWGYILLLLIAVPLHWMLPHKYRICILSFFSILFYSMWRWEFCFLMIFSAVVDYISALKIYHTDSKRTRICWLLVSLTINLGLLIGFKYTYFIYDNILLVGSFTSSSFPSLQSLGVRIILPLGISFYTFQTISYSIDVYRGVITPTRNFLSFLTYVMFWPQLIAGPVLRAKEVLPQIIKERHIQIVDIKAGMLLILAGLFMKVVIADNIAPMVDRAFAIDTRELYAMDVWVATFLFGYQIYFDFAGYSSIAIGSARLLGFRFPDNFNWPYLAVSPKEFWSRWHISLSSWIRDYLYLPLTGQKFQDRSTGGISVATETKGSRLNIALFATWFIMGLWHGAGWNFAIWGVYHASLIIIYRSIKSIDVFVKRFKPVAWIIMLMICMAGWIPFRSQNPLQTAYMFRTILSPLKYSMTDRVLDGYSYFAVIIILVGMLLVAQLKRIIEKHSETIIIKYVGTYLFIILLTSSILIYLRPLKQFIYFQF
ncbi:MAG: MBOAT family protein [Calditrichaeota bacterium]|nr:MBOAT family protein [Calditrichota bacterium]